MNHSVKKKSNLFMILFIIGLCGIGLLIGISFLQPLWEGRQESAEIKHLNTLGGGNHIQYSVPVSIPNVLVDQVGYQTDSPKTVIFRGEKLGEEFRVIDRESGKTAYSGKIEEKGLDAASGEYISYGTFTELKQEGTYYVETERIGRSYDFEISGNLYSGIFKKAYEKVTSESQIMTLEEKCYISVVLMTSSELYPDAFNENDGVGKNQEGTSDVLVFLSQQAELLLEQQDEKTGVIRQNPNLTAQAAGVLADFSNLYKSYDSIYASKCLKAAEKAWKYAEKNQNERTAGDLYFAAAELYRLTGKNVYHTVIQQYLKNRPAGKERMDLSMFGDIAYLLTEKSVVVELCSEIMEDRMNEVEEIAEQTHRQNYLICVSSPEENQERMLQQMVELATIDYVITNHEYATVMENHLHYLLGRNAKAVSYVEGIGDINSEDNRYNLLADPVKTADFIFMMAAVISHEMTE